MVQMMPLNQHTNWATQWGPVTLIANAAQILESAKAAPIGIVVTK
jgi:hypothetical protein